jgi:hypothetical protein
MMATMAERPEKTEKVDAERRTPRKRMLLTGLVVRLDQGVSFRCAIRDRSETGARLKLPTGAVAPNTFWLIAVTDGRACEATTVWRRMPDVGVVLGEPIDLTRAVEDLDHRRLRALWLEVAPRRES